MIKKNGEFRDKKDMIQNIIIIHIFNLKKLVCHIRDFVELNRHSKDNQEPELQWFFFFNEIKNLN